MRKLYIIIAMFTLCFSVVAQVDSNKEIFIQLYSVRDLINGVNKSGEASDRYLDVLSRLSQMGYTGVETANYSNGMFYGRTPDDFRKDIENSGMKVVSSHCGADLTDEEVRTGDFSKKLSWWKKCIQDHKKAGMRYIVCPYLKTIKSTSELNVFCRYFNEIGKLCEKEGIKFGYHNHAHEFQKMDNGDLMFDYMIKHTNPEYVFFQMDVYWVVRGQQSPVDYFNKYPGRFKILHIKDNREIGQSGIVGFDAIFKNINKAGVECIIAEIEGYSYSDILKSVEESAKYLLNSDFVPKSY